MRSTHSATSQLCLACGICCNGVLFRDVELLPPDDPKRLSAFGLPLQCLRTKTRFPQPCVALGSDNRCRLYADRPTHCRHFECALFKQVAAGKMDPDTALGLIRMALKLANRIKKLLHQLGNHEETLALAPRFRRTKSRLERQGYDETSASLFGELSLGVHELNLLLQRDFYPGAQD